MVEIGIYDILGKAKIVETVDLPDSIFNIDVNMNALYYTVKYQRTVSRSSIASTLTRGMVSGGGRKPWRQKGSGNARQGSIRVPHFRSGGVSHGPKGRIFSNYRINKKVKKLGLLSAISNRYACNNLYIVKEVVKDISTKAALLNLSKLINLNSNKLLFISNIDNQTLNMSIRNIPNVDLIDYRAINVFSILRSDYLIFDNSILDDFIERLK